MIEFQNEIDRDFGLSGKKLQPEDIEIAAGHLGVHPAAVKAVTEIESRGSGFIGDKPIILFERHVFYRQLADVEGIDRDDVATEHPDICNPKWGGYGKTSEQHDRLARAEQINTVAALSSASWGLFQIMGYHATNLGYPGVIEFVGRMYISEGEQLQAFVRFVQADKRLVKAIRSNDWATFARIYNGPAYARNKYDTKLAAAYARHKEALA